jgi:hypothetical protein
MLHAVYRMTRAKQIDRAPGQEHLHLPVSHRVLRHVRFVLVLIEDSDLVAALNGLSYTGQAQDIPWRILCQSSGLAKVKGRMPKLIRFCR